MLAIDPLLTDPWVDVASTREALGAGIEAAFHDVIRYRRFVFRNEAPRHRIGLEVVRGSPPTVRLEVRGPEGQRVGPRIERPLYDARSWSLRPFLPGEEQVPREWSEHIHRIVDEHADELEEAIKEGIPMGTWQTDTLRPSRDRIRAGLPLEYGRYCEDFGGARFVLSMFGGARELAVHAGGSTERFVFEDFEGIEIELFTVVDRQTGEVRPSHEVDPERLRTMEPGFFFLEKLRHVGSCLVLTAEARP